MSQEVMLERGVKEGKTWAAILYVIHALTFLLSLGMLSILPVIVNYIKRSESADTMIYSHHRWMIHSFWWYMLWMAIGGVLFITLIGIPLAWLVWFLAWVWKAYRLIRGSIDLHHNRAMPL